MSVYTVPVNRLEQWWVDPVAGWVVLCDYDIQGLSSDRYRNIDLDATLALLAREDIEVVNVFGTGLDSSLLVREADLDLATACLVDAE